MKTTTLQLKHSMKRAPYQFALLLIPLAAACFALSPQLQAVDPPPDGGYPNFTTAEGEDALFSLTGGIGNTAIGYHVLYSATDGGYNTGIGFNALAFTTTGCCNTATGYYSLYFNTTGIWNTASGYNALQQNTTGSYNSASGYNALFSNTTGSYNTADGLLALDSNTTGQHNTATGAYALVRNTTGKNNTGIGYSALVQNTTGTSNIALGYQAGGGLTTGDNNIDIGNRGIAGEANTIRIGTTGTQTNAYIAGISGATVPTGVAVIVDSSGHLGTTTSSARFKDQIKPMDKASEAILALKPVSFRYKKDLDPEGIPQFGLVAEEVEKVNPDLVARDEQGKPYAVRYEAVNAMLLNEFLKEHKKVEQFEATVSKLQAQGEEIAELKAVLKQQAAQLQKVSARLEANTPATRLVDNP
jgi:hypothetical protein